MKQRFSTSVPAVALGAAGFAVRFLQNRTGFEPDTGLPVPGNIPAILLPVLLVLAAAVLYLAACRAYPKGTVESPFAQAFRLDDRAGLFAALGGGCAAALSGLLELADTAGGITAVSADGMETVMVQPGTSGVLIGVLSAAAGVCLSAGVIASRKTNAPPLMLMAAPVCLLARLILVYRLRSVNPVLADYYLEILGLMLLILGTYRLSGFAVQAGSPRVFALYAEMTAVLALTMLADGLSAAALLTLGGALTLMGFERMLRTGPAEQPLCETE